MRYNSDDQAFAAQLIQDLTQIIRKGSLKQPIKELNKKKSIQTKKREPYEVL